ncbi:hypothetical protein J7S33_07125, partial [Saccharothrix algeriensis]
LVTYHGRAWTTTPEAGATTSACAVAAIAAPPPASAIAAPKAVTVAAIRAPIRDAFIIRPLLAVQTCPADATDPGKSTTPP